MAPTIVAVAVIQGYPVPRSGGVPAVLALPICLSREAIAHARSTVTLRSAQRGRGLTGGRNREAASGGQRGRNALYTCVRLTPRWIFVFPAVALPRAVNLCGHLVPASGQPCPGEMQGSVLLGRSAPTSCQPIPCKDAKSHRPSSPALYLQTCRSCNARGLGREAPFEPARHVQETGPARRSSVSRYVQNAKEPASRALWLTGSR